MIEEAYCSFEVAKLLKEKGFDGVVSAHYNNLGGMVMGANPISKNTVKCPTLQMAIAWILEKYNISIEVSVLKQNCWVYTIYKIFDNKVEELYNDGEFKSREQAVEAALKYCLENIIK
jgi:hypothetical protein